MLQFPDAISTEEFLNRFWQKNHVFMPQALTADLPALSADELGWLATLDDVESRIIFSDRDGSQINYRVEHGPFDEQTLSALPPQDWTLLVQDVEKHLPDFRRYIHAASFIPDWRIDDLMVSCAAPGGSVGPHRDNYDVLLCQGVGQREWRIAPANAELKTVDAGELSLLEPFTDSSPLTANSGDVLYLPPGMAHWGIATDSCITYSIGMRAPTMSEFMAGVARMQDNDVKDQKTDEIFYCDADLTASEAEPGLISDRAIGRARKSIATDATLTDNDVALVFGSVVTDVKAWLAPEEPSAAETEDILSAAMAEIRVHGMARLAYCTIDEQNLAFVNGHAKLIDADQVNLVKRICANRIATVSDDDLFRWLLAHGAFDLRPDE